MFQSETGACTYRLISRGLYTPTDSCSTSNGPSHFKVAVAAFTSSDELAMAALCSGLLSAVPRSPPACTTKHWRRSFFSPQSRGG